MQLTKSAYEALKKELEELKTVKRKEIAERLANAKGFGDLSENFEYQQAKDEQGQLERRIFELEQMLSSAEIKEHAANKEYLEMGSRFEAEVDGKNVSFELSSSAEADPLKGKISVESPIGQLFVGKKEGDRIEFTNAEGKTIVYRVKTILG